MSIPSHSTICLHSPTITDPKTSLSPIPQLT
jgi:hypothetical protein